MFVLQLTITDYSQSIIYLIDLDFTFKSGAETIGINTLEYTSYPYTGKCK